MKFKDCQYTTKKRRGLGTIVGGLIFLILMVSAFSMLGLALQTQSDMGEAARIVANANLARQQEDFKINVYTDSNQLLTVDVDNLEQNVVEVFSLVITNQTGVVAVADGYPVNIHDIPSNTSFVTPGKTENIVSTTPITLALAVNPGDIELYHFKVISSLGTIKTQSVSCDDTACGAIASAGGGLTATLFLDGPNAVNTKTSTAIMFVTNTSPVAITNVQPTAGFSPVFCDDLWTVDVSGTTQTLFVEDVDPCVVTPSSPITLDPYGTALFKWDGTIAGDIDAVFTFCSAVSGDHPDDGPITSGGPSCDSVTVIDPNDCNGCGPPGDGDDDPLDDRFITRPELFLTVPSPFGARGTDPTGPGSEPSRALWGANVVNPTETIMYIYKITITAYAPTANSNILIVENGGSDDLGCSPQDIYPGNGTIPGTPAQEAGFWSCPGENTIMWKNFANPIALSPKSIQPFAVLLESNQVGNDNVESVLVDSTVFTTSGSFGKGNYQSTWFEEGMYANIYEGDFIDTVAFDEMNTSRTGIGCGEIETFRIVLAELDQDVATFINAGSKIVVNVPRAFSGVIVDTILSTGIDVTAGEPSVVTHPDGTIQIIATLINPVGDLSVPETATLVFSAKAPFVDKNELMVMYTLATGEGSDVSSIGPLTEIILQVVPTTGPLCVP